MFVKPWQQQESTEVRNCICAMVVAVLLAGCGGSLQRVLEDTVASGDADYKSSRRLPPLEIPPDLSSDSIRESLVVPSSGEVTASELERDGARRPGTPASTAVLPEQSDIRVERNGDKR